MEAHTAVFPRTIPPLHAHRVQFYEKDDFLIDEVMSFVCAGLRMGEFCAIIATKAHHEHFEKHFEALWRESASPRLYQEQYMLLDAAELLSSFMVNDWPDQQRFFDVVGGLITKLAQAGNGRVRLFGEMVFLLWNEGKREAAIYLEELWNVLAQSHSFSLFCAYPLHAFPDSADCDSFLRICDTHSHVHPTEDYTKPTEKEKLLSTIAKLQQKASALESEIKKRQEVENLLVERDKELSDFLENAAVGLHRVGPDGKILWANRAELDLLGYAADEYIGHCITEFHADCAVIEDILGKLTSGETLNDYPARLRCKDGTIKHVLIQSNALFENGKMLHSRCFTKDITDRVQLEEKLKSKLDEISQINRRKDEFLAMLGHELRNPLAPIATSLGLMRLLECDNAVTAQSRQIMERQVILMTRLVDDLLDVSRITHGKFELRMETILLDSIVRQALELTQPLIDTLNHHLTLDLPAEPVTLVGDMARLSQVLANLLSNAAKYTEPGGQIRLSIRVEQPNLVFSVCDNGCGLSVESQEKIFELFSQGENKLGQGRGGLGVGLALVRTILQLHGGTVQAISAGVGQGSEFIVRLPLRQKI